MAAVVINPPRFGARFPKPELRMAADEGLLRNLAESGGRQKPATQSKFRLDIIKIGTHRSFWKAAPRINDAGGKPREPNHQPSAALPPSRVC
jgi:hypothetical protein